MELTVKTTFREFQEYFLGAIENATLNQYRDELLELVKYYPHHYIAWIFVARTNENLGDLNKAEMAYRRVIQLLDPSKAGYGIYLTRDEILRFAQKHNLIQFEQDILKFFKAFAIDENNVNNIAFDKKNVSKENLQTIKINAKSETKALEFIRRGNKSFSQKKFDSALNYFKKAEAYSLNPMPSLYIYMANAALGLKDADEANNLALEAIKKGMRCEKLTPNDAYVLRLIESQVYKRQQEWNLLKDAYQNQLENALTSKRKIFSIMGLIQANSKLGNIQAARDLIDELLILDPNNKTAKQMLKRLDMYESDEEIDLEELEEIGEEFAVEISHSLKVEISPMLQVDVDYYSYTDAEILKKGGKPSTSDVNRLLKDADRSLEKALKEKSEIFVYYPLYLEAEKAISDLPTEQFDEDSYHRSLSRYASLRASAFFNDFKKLILEESKSYKNRELVRRLRDSAASYYLESLRLKLDRKETIAELIVDNYIKLHAIYADYKKEINITDKYFTESFRNTANRCLRSTDTLNAFCDALLNIGSANPQNFNQIFGGGEFLGSQPRLIVVRNTKTLIRGMSNLVGISLEPNLSLSKRLKALFEKRKEQFDELYLKFNSIINIEFNPRDIKHLSEEWSSLPSESGAIYESDKELFIELGHLIDEFKPYLERSDSERFGIITYLNERISDNLNNLQKHPTYWQRIAFEPLLKSWQNALHRLVQRRSQAIQPKLEMTVDPAYLIRTPVEGRLNVLIKNIGAASAENIDTSCNIAFAEGNDDTIFSKKSNSINQLKPGDFTNWLIMITDEEMEVFNHKPLQVTLTASFNFRDQNLQFSNVYTISLEQSRKPSRDDIPWNETAAVPDELFKGRDELINKLENHYLSRDRIETYILYGLTRHGKSSIHRFLSKKLFLKIVETETVTKRFLPFFWSFATAADQGNARDMWNYLIKDCIYDKLDDYIDNKDISGKIRKNPTLSKYWKRERDFRNTHFSKILRALNEEGFLPLIAIDEFTYYTQMVDSGMVKPSFLQQIREITIDEKLACFVFAGIYDLVEILREPKYGITSQLANTVQYQVGPIDPKSAEELIQIISHKLKFTDEAVEHIKFASHNIPHFIQMICRRCGWYAVETGRNVLGVPEVDLIISTLAGENQEELPGGVKPIEGAFRDTQYRTTEIYNNAVISTVSLKSKDLKIPRSISREEMIQIWGAHRSSKDQPAGALGNFQRKLTNSIETLVQRGVLKEDRSEGVSMYRIAVDLFRRWWCVQYPSLESELDKLIGVEDSIRDF